MSIATVLFSLGVALAAMMTVFWVIGKVIERSDRKYRRRLVAESDARNPGHEG